VIPRYNIVEIKGVEQLVLRFVVAAHHRTQLRQSTHNDYFIYALLRGVFQQNRPEAVTRALRFPILSQSNDWSSIRWRVASPAPRAVSPLVIHAIAKQE
jgi:hypothetical protein